ncbi:tyrosine-type recombinase/integrase [Variovorax sp. J22R24]|uniref:tyrosine-type recombinase/integrase n=1 Tax=Variovorax gracilis TaxID=3053502 RepID=UPI002578F18A|nr:tyrosine-type recombinase/integrase [Variovorax sp. J22R24]MDM0103739.1 tyrosine-type recombinase/integrase [Variovorax sp. J22R24]
MTNETLPKVQALSESLARTLPPGEWQDKTQKSLYFYVSAKGTRSYGFYKWSSARQQPIRKSLGKWPETKAEDARKEAARLAVLVADGKDITARTASKAQTVSEFANGHAEKLKQENRAAWEWIRKILDFHAPDWSALPLDKLTKEMIAVRQRRIAYGDASHEPRGKQAGAAFVKALRALFTYAEKEHNFEGKNVAKLVDRAPGVARQRILSEAERVAIIATLDSPRWLPHVRPYFRLLMLTGARRANLAGARKEQFKLDVSEWRVPARSAKGRRELLVHLLPEAVELLRAQFARNPESPWVFPTTSGSSSGHIEELRPVWKAILKEAGVSDDITIHDLRRTFGSRLLEQETPMEVVSKLMGHRNVATTAKHYAFVTDEAAAKHLNRASL